MTPVDPEAIKREIAPFLPLRDAQMTVFTDSVLQRNTNTGACGLASCVYIEWKGTAYAVSCHHILGEDREYIAGAKRLTSNIITENDSHAVAPIELVASDSGLDLALFTLSGIDLPSIPKQAYALGENLLNRENTAKNIGSVSFIHAVPGFAMKASQYEDGLVFLKCPIYAAYGPIVEVSEDLIVGDFAEQELIEINLKDCPEFKDFQPNGGTRDLSGMSGSGLWVIYEDRFTLLGILLGPTADNKPESEHRIRFTPIWKVIAWLDTLGLSDDEVDLQRALPPMPTPPNIIPGPEPTVLGNMRSREKVRLALRRRHFLSSAPVVIISFLLLVATASILLSRTVWAEYQPWNIPSVVSGLASTAIALPVLVWITELLKNARTKKRRRNLKGIFRITIRRGYATPVFLGLTLCLIPAILIFPARDLLQELHSKIGLAGVERLQSAREFYQGKVEKAPKYLRDPGAACLGAVLDALDLDKENSPSETWDEIEKRAKPAIDDNRGYIREWSIYVTALNHANNDRLNDAKNSLSNLAEAKIVDNNIRFLAHQRLGYIEHVNRNLVAAKTHYLNALKYGQTSAIYENIGTILLHQTSFAEAETHYGTSEIFFKKERVDGVHSRAGIHYQNLASFYNNYAAVLLEKSEQPGIDDILRDSLIAGYSSRIDQADKMIESAYSAAPTDLAIYWIAASIQINAKREGKAVEWLDKAQKFLDRKDSKAAEALSQNDYATIGPFYTAWLRVRILFNLTPNSPAMPQAINDLRSTVAGFSNSPFDRIREKLIDVHATGFSDADDLPDLERMNAAGLFAAHVTPLRPPDNSNSLDQPIK